MDGVRVNHPTLVCLFGRCILDPIPPEGSQGRLRGQQPLPVPPPFAPYVDPTDPSREERLPQGPYGDPTVWEPPIEQMVSDH